MVGKAEELGIVVDLSHINEAGFWDTLDVTSFPVIASHSNARALCDSPRNLTDEQLKAIAERDGVVGGAVAIPSFVDREKPTIEKYVEHIEYMADLIGYEHVGLGFDFVYYLREWGGKSVEGFENESKIPELLNLLHERFSKKEVEGDNIQKLRTGVRENHLTPPEKPWQAEGSNLIHNLGAQEHPRLSCQPNSEHLGYSGLRG